VPDGVVTVNVVPLTPTMGSLNVRLRLPEVDTAVALVAGVRAVSRGAGPVVKVQLPVASALPAVSRMAEEPPRRVAVYRVSDARSAVGFSVAVRVVLL
jgi:hypothetical protein